jgi:guanylate kinase
LTTRRISPSADPYYESLSVEEFAKRTSEGRWIVNHQIGGSVGYATSIDEILSAAEEGLICIQSIFPGPPGAGRLREVFGTRLLSVGVLVGNGDAGSQLLELERRLLSRGRDDIEVVRARLQYQAAPIQYIMNNESIVTDEGALQVFDEIIINDNLEKALHRVIEIFAKGFGIDANAVGDE